MDMVGLLNTAQNHIWFDWQFIFCENKAYYLGVY